MVGCSLNKEIEIGRYSKVNKMLNEIETLQLLILLSVVMLMKHWNSWNVCVIVWHECTPFCSMVTDANHSLHLRDSWHRPINRHLVPVELLWQHILWGTAELTPSGHLSAPSHAKGGEVSCLSLSVIWQLGVFSLGPVTCIMSCVLRGELCLGKGFGA